MTTEEMRKAVEGYWETVECHASFSGRYSTHISIKIPDRKRFAELFTLAYWWGVGDTEDQAWNEVWQAALAYTLEHQEKVRQVEEEIFVLRDRVAFCGNWKDENGMTVYARILVREQSMLADLLRGVRAPGKEQNHDAE